MKLLEKAKAALKQIKEVKRATVAQVAVLLKAGTEEAQNLALNTMIQAGAVGQAVKSLFKKTVKSNKLVATISTEVSYNKKKKCLVMDDKIEVKKLSPAARLFGLKKAKLACKKGACNREATLDIMSIKIDSQILSDVKNGKPAGFNAVFNMFSNGVAVFYNKNTGVFRVEEVNKIARIDEEKLIYKFISITASGLRNGTFNFALVSRNGADCDKRMWALDKLTSGYFSKTFLGKDQVTDAAAFKALNRLSLGFTDSKKMSKKAETFIVFKNFAENASKKDGRTLENIMDGRVFINSKLLKASKGFESFTLNYIEKQVIQCRAEAHGLKAAGQFMSSKMLRILAKALIARGTTISYAIVDGARVEAKDLNVDTVVENLDALFDENGLKYPTNTAMELTLMKQAYASDSKLTMVVNMMMMQIDSDKFKAVASESFKAEVLSKLEGAGIKIEMKDNKITNVVFNEDSIKSNEALFSSFLFKLNPMATVALMPGLMKSQLATIVESIKNKVSSLNPTVDSKYMVVQADIGALLGAPILSCKPGNIECYCGLLNEKGVDKVSAVRNPISSLMSVTTFKVITLKEVIKRVIASNLTKEEKELVIYSYKCSETYVTIPASHYLMEKHDGMDYDIDSMCFIINVKCVEILSKAKELGTIVVNDDDRYKKLPSEVAIELWQKNKGNSPLVLPDDEKGTKDNAGTSNVNVNKGAYKKTIKSKDMNPLDKMLTLIRDFFKDPNANVGEIANAFYNNALILFAIKKLSKESAEKVAMTFRDAYGCTGDKEYVSPVTVTEDKDGFEVIKINKNLCIDVLRAFVKSNGSVESLTMFLDDCCKLNRYPAETSIDAAKNNYKITNFFKHSFILKAMGSDKTIAASMEICAESFYKDSKNACSAIGLEPKASNSFEVQTILLSKSPNGKELINVLDVKSDMEIDKDEVDIVLSEELYEIKSELKDWANEVIALASGVLSDITESIEAQELRENALSVLLNSDEEGVNLVSLIKSLNFLVTTESHISKQDIEFDEQSSVLWHKEKGLVRLANTIAVALKQDRVNLTDEQIGGSFIAAMLNGKDIMNGDYGRISLKALDAFAKYVLAYYKSIGLDISAYERITIGERGYKVSDLNGMECIVTGGHAYCDNGAILTLDNHKAECGLAVVEDGYVKFNRKTIALDPQEGVYTYGKADKTFCNDMERANHIMSDVENVEYVTNETLRVAVPVKESNGAIKKVIEMQKTTGLVYSHNGIYYRLSDRVQGIKKGDSHLRLMNSNIMKNLGGAIFRPYAVTTDGGKNINLIVRVDGVKISSAIQRAIMNERIKATAVEEKSSFFDLPEMVEETAPVAEVKKPVKTSNSGICW